MLKTNQACCSLLPATRSGSVCCCSRELRPQQQSREARLLNVDSSLSDFSPAPELPLAAVLIRESFVRDAQESGPILDLLQGRAGAHAVAVNATAPHNGLQAVSRRRNREAAYSRWSKREA